LERDELLVMSPRELNGHLLYLTQFFPNGTFNEIEKLGNTNKEFVMAQIAAQITTTGRSQYTPRVSNFRNDLMEHVKHVLSFAEITVSCRKHAANTFALMFDLGNSAAVPTQFRFDDFIKDRGSRYSGIFDTVTAPFVERDAYLRLLSWHLRLTGGTKSVPTHREKPTSAFHFLLARWKVEFAEKYGHELFNNRQTINT